MATLRDIRNRIKAVGKTQKITRAMYLVAAARMSRAQAAIVRARPYAEKLSEVMASVAAGVEADAHPLLEPRESVQAVDVVVFASDRGLCGGYNSNVLKHAETLVRRLRDAGQRVSVVAVGARGQEHFQRRGIAELPRSWEQLGTVSSAHAAEIARYLMERYRRGESDQTRIVYSTFVTALTQRPGDRQLLPLETEALAEVTQYEIEPDPVALLGRLVPQTVEFEIFRALLENQAGEYAARMTAMDSATKNTEDLIETLTMDFNKARQASITAQLVEIVSGAEAL